MTTEASRNSRFSEYTYTPPILPSHLAVILDLKPIVGYPNEEDVKKIHAAIRAVNVESQVPHLHNPDLLLQLSQHLFSVQMAIYRDTYPQNPFPGDNTYTPPQLPAHIPIALEPVVGVPSNEQLKAAQDAMRVSESLASSPLFESNLNMKLSQHLFSLQFASYIQGSTLGQFTSKSGEPRRVLPTTQESPIDSPTPQNITNAPTKGNTVLGEHIPNDANEASVSHSSVAEPVNRKCCTPASITQLGEAVNTIKELMSESKGVLENMNRVMIAIQRNQVTVGEWDHHSYAHVNPVNQQGMTAV
ncbi:unnamed protein product, partial [Rhizoctonia solani]